MHIQYFCCITILSLLVKYRRQVFDETVSERAKEIFVYIAPKYNITLQEWNHDKDHVHILFRAHPNSEISKFINAYKSASSRLLKKEFPQIRQKLWKECFWSQSFCLLTTGGAPIEVIRKYIESQGEKSHKRADLMANKAYKFRIYPNREQKTLFAKTFGCVRFIYNKMLDDKIKYYEKTKKRLNNTPAQYKKEFPWLKEVDSLALANAQMNLQKAYNNFFRDPKVGFPKFKSRHKTRASYTTNNQKGTVALEDGCLKLPKAGYVKVKQHRAIPEDYRIKSVTISQNRAGTIMQAFCSSTKTKYKNSPCINFSVWIFPCRNCIGTVKAENRNIRDITEKRNRN